jgi:hypothetical protein
MARKRMLSLCLAGAFALPASVALACHLHSASVEIGCTQYKINVVGIGVSPSHVIKYTLNVPSSDGGQPVTISNTVSLTGRAGDITEVVSNPLTLSGKYDVRALSGKASIVNGSHVENTVDVTAAPTSLNCDRPGS